MPVKPFDNYDGDDVQALLRNQVPEGRALDYKRDLPGTSDDDKKEFLADVSSFANTNGGDLIIGIDEEDSLPTEIVGVPVANLDECILRLEDMIRSGIQPRVRAHIRAISVGVDTAVLWVRIDASWDAPHRVIFRGWDKFYGRNSKGKYPLDTTELRNVFLRTGGAIDAVEQFRDQRVQALEANRGPVALGRRAIAAVHLLPLEAFTGRISYDVIGLPDWQLRVQPMARNGWDHRITLQGILGFSVVQTMPVSYMHVYRTGVVEFADTATMGAPEYARPSVPSQAFEQRVIKAATQGLHVQRDLGVRPPIYCFISLINVAGMTLGIRDDYSLATDRIPLTEDRILLPEAVFGDFAGATDSILRPSFDVFWNAFGHERSPNFTPDGTWRPI